MTAAYLVVQEKFENAAVEPTAWGDSWTNDGYYKYKRSRWGMPLGGSYAVTSQIGIVNAELMKMAVDDPARARALAALK